MNGMVQAAVSTKTAKCLARRQSVQWRRARGAAGCDCSDKFKNTLNDHCNDRFNDDFYNYFFFAVI